MMTILIIILAIFIAVLCCFAAIGNLARRRRQPRQPILSLENLELLKEQGMITEEEFESMKEGAQRPQELMIESCTFSADEIMEAIEAALDPVDALKIDDGCTGSREWVEVLGMEIELNLSLKELTLISMKIAKPQPAIDVIAKILAMSIPVALFSAQASDQADGRSALPNYKTAARMIWIRLRERLSEPISILKEIHEQRKIPEQELLARLVSMVIESLNIPVTASGMAAIFALMIAKMEFNAFSDDDEDESF